MQRRGPRRLQPRHRTQPRRRLGLASRGQELPVDWSATRRPLPTSTAPSNSTQVTPGPRRPRRNIPSAGPQRRVPRGLQPRHRTRPRLSLGHRRPRPDPLRWGATRRPSPTSTAPSSSPQATPARRRPRRGLPEMGRYEEALADFNRAIELDPSDAWDRRQPRAKPTG